MEGLRRTVRTSKLGEKAAVGKPMATAHDSRQQGNDEKLKELILFVCMESAGDERFSATKLNKLLFYADFLYYQRTGQSITGQEYQALDHGPAPRKMVPLRKELAREGRVAEHTVKYFGREQKRLFGLDEPNLDIFSGAEVSFVKNLIQRYWERNASELSEMSHNFIGWQLAEVGETIPYEVSLVAPGNPTLAQRRRAAMIESAIMALDAA